MGPIATELIRKLEFFFNARPSVEQQFKTKTYQRSSSMLEALIHFSLFSFSNRVLFCLQRIRFIVFICILLFFSFVLLLLRRLICYGEGFDNDYEISCKNLLLAHTILHRIEYNDYAHVFDGNGATLKLC